MTAWLITPDALSEFRAKTENVVPTAEQLTAFEASFGDQDFPGSRIMSKAGNVANIEIGGTLTKTPSWMARYFGGGNTAYNELISAINEAERDPNIREIIFTIDSPGGVTNGLTGAMDAIKNATKPTRAVVQGQACSAAYGLASQADQITATDRGSIVGSIGVAASYFAHPSIVDIASTNAPDKRPDVTTDEGKATVREMLDQIEAVFIKDIAAGRGVDVEVVKTDFGRGGIFLADIALKNGMIDSIEETARATAGKTQATKAKTMDLKTLQAEHPDVYNAAVKVGIDEERDRVGAHLEMGAASGDMTTAIAACKDGSAMTATLQAKYMAAGMKQANLNARAGDDAEAGAAANNTTQTKDEPSAFDDALDAIVNK